MRISSAALRLAALLLVVTLVAACGTPEQKAAQHYARALEHVEAGDDARAMAELRNVLRLDPKHADAIFQIGLIHERAERWPQAFSAFQEVAAEQPGHIGANLRLGELALRSETTLDIAEKAAADILANEPDHPDGRVLEAAVMLRKGDLQRALNTAEAVLAEDPRHENAVAVVAGVLQSRGRTDEAIARVDAALALVPDSLQLRFAKLLLLENIEDAAGLRTLYHELVELRPDDPEFRLALVSFHQRQGDLAGAEAALREAVDQLGPVDELARSLVLAVYRQEGPEAAEAELRRLIERRPEASSLRFLLAQLLITEGRRADAEVVLQGIADSDDREAGRDARATIGQLRLQAEDLDGAKTLADAVIAQDRDHRGANYVRGLVHLIEGQPEDALRVARAALRRDPQWAPAFKLAAEAHLRRGERDLAISALGQAVTLAPTDAEMAVLLATLLSEAGDVDAALRVWDRLIEAQRGDPGQAFAARARIHLSQGQWAAAQEDIQRLAALPGEELGATLLAGDLELARSRYDQSRAWFGRALETSPDTLQPVVGIVRAYVWEGNVDGALTFLEERLATSPDDPLLHMLQGGLLAEHGDPAKAIVAYEAAISLSQSWVLPYRSLGRLHWLRLGDLDAAIAIYDRGLSAIPDQRDLLSDLAETLLAASHYERSKQVYARLIELDPSDDIAVNNFGALVADHAFDDEEAFANALALAQRFRTSNVGAFLDTLGWLTYRTGDYAVAVTYLQRALAELGDVPQVRYHLGMALKGTGQTERAQLELQQAVAEGANYWGREEAEAALEALARAAEPAVGG